MPTAGRDQLRPMQRIVRIMAMLHDRQQQGVSADELVSIAGYGDADPRTQLGKDLNHLRGQGWQIDNTAGPGEAATYKMVPGDNRLRLALTPDQVAALQRAMILADRADLAQRLDVTAATIARGVGPAVAEHPPSSELSRALDAVRLRSRIRFSYKGGPRTVHPASVRFRAGQWYLTGLEDGSTVTKHFVVSRMSSAVLDPPGTADPVGDVRDMPLHPLSWEVDPPVEVVLRTDLDYEPDVVRLLREPARRAERDGVVDLTYVVTHRTAMRARLYALGRRVVLVSPAEVRDEVLAELREMVGE